jgi:hypothetical protein
MLIGYVPVSTDDQTLTLQRNAPNAAGCKWVFEDRGISGTTRTRLGLDLAFSRIRLAAYSAPVLGLPLEVGLRTFAEAKPDDC